MSIPSLASTYDALPYVSRALSKSHPDVLSVAATLHGMTPAPVDKCRVLELGCASGGNLWPMAAQYSDSHFVGIDLSPRQIADGQQVVDELGLKNLELRAADLLMLDPSIGLFDYIICHGVYSWVPPPVQERILEICAQHLSPQGVAYISYNIYPGFHKRQPFREMMQYHTAGIANPVEAAQQGRALLEFLLKNVEDQNGTYARLLRDELEKLRTSSPAYLFHEHLEPDNHPCYFHEFMARASRHGLQFLAEAEGKGGLESLPEAAQEALFGLRHDIVKREQYIDFLRNSTLRSTLLCRREVSLHYDLSPRQVREFLVLSSATPDEENPDLRSFTPVRFQSRRGSATVEHPAFKSMLMALHRLQPQALRVAELVAPIARLLEQTLSEEDISEMVLAAYGLGLLSLHTRAPRLAASLSDRPCATSLTRLQARRNLGVSSAWHEAVATNSIERQILQRLDGTRDQQRLCAELVAALHAGALSEQPELLRNADAAVDWMPSLLTQILTRFFADGLLES